MVNKITDDYSNLFKEIESSNYLENTVFGYSEEFFKESNVADNIHFVSKPNEESMSENQNNV